MTGGTTARTWRRVAAAAAAVTVLVATGCGGLGTDDADPARGPTSTGAGPTDAPVEGRRVEVTSITDGDTFRAGDERVRLLAIDAPETAQGPECWGDEATAALADLLPVGSTVTLVTDVEETDRYDRTLAWVVRPDGIEVNLSLVMGGHATPLIIAPNDRYEHVVTQAAETARERGRGMWAECPDPTAPATSAPAPTTAPPDPAPTTAPPTAPSGPGCDPSYPTVCIPPSPPDLDCADVPHQDFVVRPPDPHRFDGGGDGLGCESDR